MLGKNKRCLVSLKNPERTAKPEKRETEGDAWGRAVAATPVLMETQARISRDPPSVFRREGRKPRKMAGKFSTEDPYPGSLSPPLYPAKTREEMQR